MEEKKTEEKKENKGEKLSYEKLKGMAEFISAKADVLAKENEELKNLLSNKTQEKLYAELSLLFKVVEYATSFNKEFVNKCIKTIEKVMLPQDKEDGSEE